MDLSRASETDLWAELQSRGAALHVGYCYPAMASDPEATELITQHGYEYGPWQFVELGHKLAEPPQWPLFSQVPPKFRPSMNGWEESDRLTSIQQRDLATEQRITNTNSSIDSASDTDQDFSQNHARYSENKNE